MSLHKPAPIASVCRRTGVRSGDDRRKRLGKTAWRNAGPSGAPAPTKAMQIRATILTGPILPTLVKLALPTMTVLLAQTAVSIAEAYYVGYLGTDALAGVALVFPVFMLMTMMSNGGLGSGVASAVARAIGAGHKAMPTPWCCMRVVLAVIVGATVHPSAPSGAARRCTARLAAASGALDAALKYSNYLFAGAIPVWIVNLLAAALRGSGNVKVPATVTLVGAMVLIPCSPLLIFGFGPIPRLGIAGAGMAFTLYYGARHVRAAALHDDGTLRPDAEVGAAARAGCSRIS